MSVFDVILDLILDHEGGKCNRPTDPGGKTNRGITQKTYDLQRKEIMEQKGVKPEEIPKQKDVYDLTDQEIKNFYKYQFNRYSANKIENPNTCYVFFDAVINMGPGQATKFLQCACNLDQDGRFGPNTQAMVNSLNQRELQTNMLKYREDYYKTCGSYEYHKNGWANRVNKIRQQIEKGIMTNNQQNNNNQMIQQQKMIDKSQQTYIYEEPYFEPLNQPQFTQIQQQQTNYFQGNYFEQIPHKMPNEIYYQQFQKKK